MAENFSVYLLVDSKNRTPFGLSAAYTFSNPRRQYSTCSKTDDAIMTSYLSLPISVSSTLPSSISGTMPLRLPISIPSRSVAG